MIFYTRGDWETEFMVYDSMKAVGFRARGPLKRTFGNRKNYERYKAEAKQNFWQVYLNLLGMGYNLTIEDLI